MPLSSDVITANRFSITIDGYEIATFQELIGITSEVEASDYWSTSGDKVAVDKLPGKFKPPEITLKRGMTGSLELWSWHESVRTGTMGAARRSCSLTMFNAAGKPVGKYWLEKAWPKKMDLAGLKAGAGEALIETVVLTCEVHSAGGALSVATLETQRAANDALPTLTRASWPNPVDFWYARSSATCWLAAALPQSRASRGRVVAPSLASL